MTAVAITPDGLQLVSVSRDKTIKIWNLASGTRQLTLRGHRHCVTAVAITPDGSKIISAELILADWIEFLQCNEIESEICYRWYHPSFCQFLKSDYISS